MRNINKDTVEIFSKNVKWLRKTNKLSKKQMSEILNIGLGSLNKIEKEILPQRLSVNVLFTIKNHFGISAKRMLGEKLYR